MKGVYTLKKDSQEYIDASIIITGIVKRLEELYAEKSPYRSVHLDLLDVGPSLIFQILEDNGYESHWEDDNGWEQDTWYTLYKEGHPMLTLFWEGYTFSMELSIRDSEEEDNASE